MGNDEMPIEPKALISRFLKLFVLLLVLTVAATYPLIAINEANRLQSLVDQQSGYVDAVEEMFQALFEQSHTALLYLSRDPSLQDYLRAAGPDSADRVKRRFSDFLLTYRRFNQIRWLDADGREAIRVNYVDGRTQVVADDKLQDKSARYYFQIANRLEPGGYYVSPMDLNMENGRVEVPHKPMVRFALPIFDDHGKRRGVLVANHFGRLFLDLFDSLMSHGQAGHGALFNNEGYGMHTVYPGFDWGFMLNHPEHRVAHSFPGLWAAMQADHRGHVETPAGLFIYRQFDPLAEIFQQAGPADAVGEGTPYRWWVVRHVAPDQIAATTILHSGLGMGWLLFTVILLVAASLSGALWRSHQASHREHIAKLRAESDRRIRHFLDAAPDAFVVMDPEGEVLMVNRRFSEVFGWPAQRAVGESLTTLLDPQPANGGPWRLPEAGCGKHEDTIDTVEEISLSRQDGSSFPASLHFRCTASEGRRVFTLLIRDVTQDFAARQELIAAKQAADGASQAKSEFLANMNHELNTPLNGVLGMAQLLAVTDLNATQLEYVGTILDTGNALRVLVTDILDFTAIEAGRMRLTPEWFDLEQTCRQVDATITLESPGRGVKTAVDYGAGCPTKVFADPARIRQLLTNLLANAAKFTTEGQIVTRVRVVEEQGGEATLKFEVEDTGIGIPKDQRERIFLAFTQVDGSLSRPYQGLGLGLAVCKQLVDRMGGTLGVESELGKGSKFWFELQAPVSPLK
jgi:PAS domain S-box-containing protein